MSYLDKLRISKRMMPPAAPRQQAETIEHRRHKLIANIEEQIELAQLAMDQKPLILKRKRGHNVVEVRPRLWWKAERDGQILAQVRYNKMPLNLDRRGSTIEVGPLNKLVPVLRTVIKAAKAGELDNAIEAAAKKKRG